MKKVIMLLFVSGLIVTASAGSICLVNDTGSYDICYIYISVNYEEAWGDNWLDFDEILLPGDSITFSTLDSVYNIRLIDEDNDEYIRFGVDVYGSYVWNVTLDDLGELDNDGYPGGVIDSGDSPAKQ
ncbi:MAG: hypothetical protein K8S24_11655 [Candidatus Aegiribacteria sp.]|nr:hypothetical protein [Candidatus Aegiribacteria sp.]